MKSNCIFKLLFLAFLFINLTSCNEKEKYDKLLILDKPESSDYKECTSYIRTVLLPNRKITTRVNSIQMKTGKINYNEQIITKGKNLIAFYYFDYNMEVCVTHGYYSLAAYLEFVDFQPQLEKVYNLPHKQINIYIKSDGGEDLIPIPRDPQKITGRIIFHRFSYDQVKASLLLDDPLTRVNGRNLTFKSFKETFYDEKEAGYFPNLN